MARAADRTEPGELAEGDVRAFGLAVPRRLHADTRFEDSVSASGLVPAEQVLGYIKKRIEPANAELAPGKTLIKKAHVLGQPSSSSVHIEVASEGGNTRLLVRDTTPAPVEPGLDEAERWKRAGFTAEGRQDPSTLR